MSSVCGIGNVKIWGILGNTDRHDTHVPIPLVRLPLVRWLIPLLVVAGFVIYLSTPWFGNARIASAIDTRGSSRRVLCAAGRWAGSQESVPPHRRRQSTACSIDQVRRPAYPKPASSDRSRRKARRNSFLEERERQVAWLRVYMDPVRSSMSRRRARR
jgi:hypothetical protein